MLRRRSHPQGAGRLKPVFLHHEDSAEKSGPGTAPANRGARQRLQACCDGLFDIDGKERGVVIRIELRAGIVASACDTRYSGDPVGHAGVVGAITAPPLEGGAAIPLSMPTLAENTSRFAAAT